MTYFRHIRARRHPSFLSQLFIIWSLSVFSLYIYSCLTSLSYGQKAQTRFSSAFTSLRSDFSRQKTNFTIFPPKYDHSGLLNPTQKILIPLSLRLSYEIDSPAFTYKRLSLLLPFGSPVNGSMLSFWCHLIMFQIIL